MRIRFALAALTLIAAASTVQAQALVAPKIAVVRSADVVRDSVQFKAAETKMKGEFDKRRSDLEAQALADRVGQMQPDWWVQPCRLGGTAAQHAVAGESIGLIKRAQA